jgi:hypothetical protein
LLLYAVYGNGRTSKEIRRSTGCQGSKGRGYL